MVRNRWTVFHIFKSDRVMVNDQKVMLLLKEISSKSNNLSQRWYVFGDNFHMFDSGINTEIFLVIYDRNVLLSVEICTTFV